MPETEPTYFTEITRYTRLYSSYGSPRDLEAARTLILSMAIEHGYGPADVQALLLMISGQPS